MSQKLGAIFITAALGPVSYAGRCIMSRRVTEGLAELTPDNLLGGVERGVETVAAATSLPKRYVSDLLPMAQLHALATHIAARQEEAAKQWDIHTSHIGGLLEGVADLTVDGREPDTALCLLRLSKKMQMDKALAAPLRELSEDLEKWHHMVETCRIVIDDGASLRNAYLQKRILRWGLGVTALLGAVAAVIWFVRVDRARGRIDALISAENPCAVADVTESDLAKASSDQLGTVEDRKRACEEQRREAERLAAEKQRQQELRAKREAEERAAAERCKALRQALEEGRADWASLPAATTHRPLLERIANGRITAEDLAKAITLPCPDLDLRQAAGPAFARYALVNPGEWINDQLLHPSARDLIVAGQQAVPERHRLVFMNAVGALAERTVLMGGEEAMQRVLRLCELLDELGMPDKPRCGAARTAAER